MEPQKPFAAQDKPTTPKPDTPPYEPPQATFIPLKMEERLLACEKEAPGPCVLGPIQS